MLSRGDFLALLAAAIAAPGRLHAGPRRGRTALYAGVGATLTHYDLDVDTATLVARESVKLPANVQYAWPHLSGRFLYVASSDTTVGPGARAGTVHRINVFRVGPTGALAPHGDAVVLPARPIHLTTDARSEHLMVAFNNPSGLRVYRIAPGGTVGAEVPQSEAIDFGVYAHQVRVTRDNRLVILATRGNDAGAGRAEDPGALKVFRYQRGRLTAETSIAPRGGFGFGPRHLDFHPTQPWIYVSRERENALSLFRRAGDRLEAEPAYTKGTLAGPSTTRQQAGAVHVHPNGRFVYGANRLDLGAMTQWTPLKVAGDNSLVVFAIDPATGEPTPLQHVDTRGIHDRTFHIDPTGRVLVTAHLRPVDVADGAGIRHVPAGLAVFRIGQDGRLAEVRKYDLEVGGDQLFWMGMVALRA